MATSEILQFASQDTGSNLLTQSEYEGDAQRVIGHQPGIARSRLENKVLRQTSLMAAGLAQFMAANQSSDITDGLSAQDIADALNLSLENKIAAIGIGGINILNCVPKNTEPLVNITNSSAFAAELSVQGGGKFIVGGYKYSAEQSSSFTTNSQVNFSAQVQISGSSFVTGKIIAPAVPKASIASGLNVYTTQTYTGSTVTLERVYGRPTVATFSFSGNFIFILFA